MYPILPTNDKNFFLIDKKQNFQINNKSKIKIIKIKKDTFCTFKQDAHNFTKNKNKNQQFI